MAILPTPTAPLQGGSVLYELLLPDDVDYRKVLVGALSLAADTGSYQSRVPSDPNIGDAAAAGSLAIESLQIAAGGDVVGEFRYAAFASLSDAPDNWLLCNGQTVSAAAYPDLLASCVFVTDVGFGSIRLPDFEGRVARMFDDNNAVGTLAGANDVTLTVAQMPAHSHGYSRAGSRFAIFQGELPPVSPYVPPLVSGTTASVGGGGSHENRSASYNVQVWVVAR